MIRPTDGIESRRSDRPLLLLFLATALTLRLLSFVYSVHNYDESLYILMGSELTKGHLPYTTVCDLKPVGLFAIFAVLTALPLDGVVTARLAASLVVGLTAYLLSRMAALLFGDETRSIGVTAGLAYIVFTLANGGMAAQAELFHNACAALAFCLIFPRQDDTSAPRLATFVTAGLVLGAGLQIKQSVAFDMLALVIGFFVMRVARRTAPGPALRTGILGLAALGAASAVPTLVVILVYTLAGALDAWIAGNVTAHRVFYGPERPFEFDPAFRALWEQAPLWFGAILSLLLAGRLTRSNREVRACVCLAAWLAAIMLGQIFLRIASDHYFLQFLSPLSLLTGLLLGRGVLAAMPMPTARMSLLALFTGITFYAVAKQPLLHTFYILKDRFIAGETWAGDTPRRIAADLRPILQPADALYVVGFQPLVYYLTQAKLATRFAFTGLPHRDFPGRDGCPWVDQRVEMQRVLDSEARFIVIEDGIFFHELRPDVKSMLSDRLARDYRLLKRYDQHGMHHLYPFERFVMNGGAPAEVYERVQPAGKTAGDPR